MDGKGTGKYYDDDEWVTNEYAEDVRVSFDIQTQIEHCAIQLSVTENHKNTREKELLFSTTGRHWDEWIKDDEEYS